METRATYKQKLVEQLKEWNARIVWLEAAVEKAGPEMKIRLAKEFHELRAMQRAAAEKMTELGLVSGDALGRCTPSADKVWADLKTGIAKIEAKLRDIDKLTR